MLGNLAPVDLVRVIGCFAWDPPPLLAACWVSPRDVFLVAVDSELRLEEVVALPLETVSLSLGAVKDPVLFLGIARMSSLDSFFPSADTLAAWSEFWEPLSVSAPSLSDASPRRARRSMEARVGRGADRLLDLVRTCWFKVFDVLPLSSFCRGAVSFLLRLEGREISWSEDVVSVQ